VVTKADAQIAPKLVICAGIGTIKQMLWARSTGFDRLRPSLPQLVAILYNLVRSETGHLRATNMSQSVSSARAPLEECLRYKKFDHFSIVFRSFFDRFSIVFDRFGRFLVVVS